MDIIAALDGGLALVGKVMDIVKDGRDLRVEKTEAVGHLLDLREGLLAAKMEYFEMLQRYDELEKKLRRLQQFEVESQKYELQALASNTLAYGLKPDAKGIEPDHYLCTRCFEDAKKSILQFARSEFYFDVLKCPVCGNEARVPNDSRPTIMTAKVRSKWDDY